MATENLALSNTDRLRALEIAQEIRERDERYAIATAIENRLTPSEDGNSSDFGAWRLAQLLGELLSDTGQQCRLIELLDTEATT